MNRVARQTVVSAITCAIWLVALPVFGQSEMTIAYRIGWDAPNSHDFHIEMSIGNPGAVSVDVRIPDWRPGRYVIQDFAKNIVRFRAVSGSGTPLPFQKRDKTTWRVQTGGAGRVVVKYDYYARQLDGGASYLDDAEAYFNPITCFMYVPGKELLPVSLAIDKPANWRVAAAFDLDAAAGVYRSENYHELVDTPVIVSPTLRIESFEYRGATFELVFQGEARYDAKKVIADVRKIVAGQVDMMDDVPFTRYVFLYHLVPYRFGHGVEHKNSTSIVTGPADFDDEKWYRGFLGVTSHEFFHVWNVERIRPEGIFLPDYSKPNLTTQLWVSEGITSYYGGLTLRRAGLTETKKYLAGWAKTLARRLASPAYKVMNVAEVSWEIWSKIHGAPPNTYYSFYSGGNILGLMLDLEIRQRTKNKKSLDDVFRYLNREYARKNRGVPENGLHEAVNRVTGKDFDAFFQDYVYGTRDVDFNRFLNYAGLALVEKKDDKAPRADLGIRLRGDDKQSKIVNVLPDSPAYRAGLDLDDVLIAIDGRRAHADNLERLLRNYQPGDTVQVTVIRREHLREFAVVLGKPLQRKYEIKEIEKPSRLQAKIRKSWLREKEENLESGAASR